MDERVPASSGELGPELTMLRQLWRVNHAMLRMSHRMAATIGVTAQQRLLLRVVARAPGIAPVAVARLLVLDEGTVSTAVSRLVGAGLLERTRSTLDHRRHELVVTPAGLALLDLPGPTVEGSVADLLGGTAASDLAAVGEVLGGLADRLERALDDPLADRSDGR